MKRINLRLFLLLMLMLTASATMYAQRHTDNLNRGLVAVQSGSDVFLSWRVQDDEYYDVKYNVYCNGSKLNNEPLEVSNFLHKGGTASTQYSVKAVIVDENGNETVIPERTTKITPAATRVFATADAGGNAPSYLSFNLADVYDRNNNLVFCSCGQNHNVNPSHAQTYIINEASVADLDGDGEVELMVKRLNLSDADSSDPYAFDFVNENNQTVKGLCTANNTRAFVLIEVYKLDGTRLWWIDCGPNMASPNSVELNCIAYDWDGDGKAEFLMRGADNMIIHTKDNRTITVGENTVNSRVTDVEETNVIPGMSHTDPQYAWTKTGNEYLVYLNGETGLPFTGVSNNVYTPQHYPLARLEGSEQMKVWDDHPTQYWKNGYGHRSSKYFMGAPYLDGKKPSLFLGRGIYSQIKMCALTLNTSTHKWGDDNGNELYLNQTSGTNFHKVSNTKWYWKCNDHNNGNPWYGQGFHNFVIADVDMDGRDEIVYGSMVIDDNGQGLTTTGLGHGDAMHVGDFDPYRKGMEIFTCNEDDPANNYRDAVTSQYIYRYYDSSMKSATERNDDGRAMAANVTNRYPGCVVKSAHSDYISATAAGANNTLKNPITDNAQSNFGGNYSDYSPKMELNFRLFWDGDLLDETLNGDDTEGECLVYKADLYQPIMSTSGCKLINDTKNNPTFCGDILGDWREEVILRSADNKHIRIYSTDRPTEHRIPCLWYDHQYRNGMVTQTFVYNQPPHPSFFVGELEDITKAPVPLTNKAIANGNGTYRRENRVSIANDNAITTDCNGKEVQLEMPSSYSTSDIKYGIASAGVSPSLLVVNTPVITKGTSGNYNPTTNVTPTTEYYTYLLGYDSYKGDLSGQMRFVKQGEGMLKVTNREFSYSGDTEIWGGSMAFHGTLKNSHVWMNRHTTMCTKGEYPQGITMEYGATLYPMTKNKVSADDVATVTIGTLELHEGAMVELNFDASDETKRDMLNLTNLKVRKRDWDYGPKYDAPVFRFKTLPNAYTNGQYKIGTVSQSVSGKASDIIVTDASGNVQSNMSIHVYDKVLYLCVGNWEEEESVTTDPEYFSGNADWELLFEDVLDNYTTRMNDKTDNASAYNIYRSYGFSDKNSAEFYLKELADGSHCLNIRSKGSGMRTANLSFSNPIFTNNCDYTFEFDWGLSSASGAVKEDDKSYVSTIEMVSNIGTLFKIVDNGNYTTVPLDLRDLSTLYDGNGNAICNLMKDVHGTSDSGPMPTTISHFKITSTLNGTFLTITCGATVIVDNYKLKDSFVNLTALNTTLGRTYAQMVLDDMKLFYMKPSLSDKKYMPESGNYAEVNVDRVFTTNLKKDGEKYEYTYNTFCIPFTTTPEEVTGVTGTKAYTLKAVNEKNGTITVKFEEVSEIEANMPYLLGVPKDDTDNATLAAQTFHDKYVYQAQSETKTVNNGWKFISNYTPSFSLYDANKRRYMLYNNELWFCGNNNGTPVGRNYKLNGMRAYFEEVDMPTYMGAPKFVLQFGDSEVTGIINFTDDGYTTECIYDVSGVRRQVLQRGINIVRTAGGKVKKVFAR